MSKKFVIEDGKLYQQWTVDKKNEKKCIEKKFIGDIYIKEGSASFSNTEDDQRERKIIVVGIRYKERMFVIPNKSIQSNSSVILKSEKDTILKLGHSITHPNDKYNYEFGVHLAISKALNSHRYLITNSFSMLAKDRFENIVSDELTYIENNLERYV